MKVLVDLQCSEGHFYKNTSIENINRKSMELNDFVVEIQSSLTFINGNK